MKKFYNLKIITASCYNISTLLLNNYFSELSLASGNNKVILVNDKHKSNVISRIIIHSTSPNQFVKYYVRKKHLEKTTDKVFKT